MLLAEFVKIIALKDLIAELREAHTLSLVDRHPRFNAIFGKHGADSEVLANVPEEGYNVEVAVEVIIVDVGNGRKRFAKTSLNVRVDLIELSLEPANVVVDFSLR